MQCTGGGGAGLAAAVSAADNGAKVILVEKTGALGGNIVRAGGPYNAVDPADKLMQNLLTKQVWKKLQNLHKQKQKTSVMLS